MINNGIFNAKLMIPKVLSDIVGKIECSANSNNCATPIKPPKLILFGVTNIHMPNVNKTDPTIKLIYFFIAFSLYTVTSRVTMRYL